MALRSLGNRAAALAVAAMFATGGAAIAQQQTAPTPPQDSAPSAADIQAQIDPVSDAEIDQFVEANTAVTTIAQSANADLQAAEDQAAATEIQADAQEKMMAAIEDKGLTPQRFTEIIALARADSDFAQKLQAKMEG